MRRVIDDVGVTVILDDRPRTTAYTAVQTLEIDAAQFAIGDRSCLDAFRNNRENLVGMSIARQRWLGFAAADAIGSLTAYCPTRLAASSFGCVVWLRRQGVCRSRRPEPRTPSPTRRCHMPRRKPGPSVKDPEMYEALRDEGASKEKAARISNAAANTSRSAVGRTGGQHGDYEDWTKADLTKRARELGIEGRSSMSKAELISALRNH